MESNLTKAIAAILALLLSTSFAQAKGASQERISCPTSMLTPTFQAKAAQALTEVSEKIQKGHFSYPETLREFTNRFVNAMFDVHAIIHHDERWNILAGNNNAYQHGKAPSLAQSCFPGIKKLYSEYHERAVAIAEKQRSAEKLKEAKLHTPEKELRDLYERYISVKACYETRKGYAVVLIDDAQMQKARRRIKALEQSLLKSDPGLDTNLTWKKATERFKGSPVDISVGIVRLGGLEKLSFAKSLCVASYEALVSDQDRSDLLKKDF